MKLVILDRDGVINEDSDNYIKSAEQWRPIAGSIEAITYLHQSGFTIAIATNQSGLSRGLFQLSDLEDMHAKLHRLVEEQGGKIAAIFYCPHKPEQHCHCRKPNPGLIDAIEAEFGTSVRGVPLVGDSLRDLQVAIAKGCQPILVKTGKGLSTLKVLQQQPVPELQNLTVVDNLRSAATYIVENF